MRFSGTVWVYRTSSVNYKDKDSLIYCDYLTYSMAYWTILVTYIIMAIFIFGTCCCGCCAICFGRRSTNTNAFSSQA